MTNNELLIALQECSECICEHCPYIAEKDNPVKCMTKLVGDAAKALEKLMEGVCCTIVS